MEIHGVPVHSKDGEEVDVQEVIKDVSEKIEVYYSPADIHKTHRLQIVVVSDSETTTKWSTRKIDENGGEYWPGRRTATRMR
ncbi:hypothetical protein J6590_053323 [Homalodisca vitripennis]|nr:hypothetical protein J6590_053323 [Homalodisca vitripennis]